MSARNLLPRTTTRLINGPRIGPEQARHSLYATSQDCAIVCTVKTTLDRLSSASNGRLRGRSLRRHPLEKHPPPLSPQTSCQKNEPANNWEAVRRSTSQKCTALVPRSASHAAASRA